MNSGATARSGRRPPRDVAVVGAGMVGLSTAWFLLQQGVSVTVFDRDRAGAGASWGNAGWLPPALTTPLPEPAVLSYGLRTMLKPSSPVYVPPRADLRLWRFLAGFVRHCTPRRWKSAMAAYAPVNRIALAAYDVLHDAAAVPPERVADPFLMAFGQGRERDAMLRELELIRQVQPVEFDLLTGEQARDLEPALSERVGAALRLHGQRYINPPEFVRSLADSVVANGGKLHEDAAIERLEESGDAVVLEDSRRQRHNFDAVVLASGVMLGDLAAQFGVRRLVQAGRGYSFNVECRHLPSGPLYFPAQRVACTPLETPRGMRLRVAGMMEFRSPSEPLDPRRVAAIINAVSPLLLGADFDGRNDDWVGSRPCTTDGLPLVGATNAPRVFVAGGHGMWGIALGPVTGQLLAQQIVTGTTPSELAPFNPLR